MNDDELRQEVQHHDREIDDLYDELSIVRAEISIRLDTVDDEIVLRSPRFADPGPVVEAPAAIADLTAWRCVSGDCGAWGAELMPEWSTTEISGWGCPRCGWYPVILTDYGASLARLRAAHMEDRDPF